MQNDWQSFTTFGALLRFVRRRARLTQRDLGLAVGYSEGHINRFEKNKHIPDPATVAALFVPELGLAHEPELAARLIALAAPPAAAPAPNNAEQPEHLPGLPYDLALEPIPPAPAHEIPRPKMLQRLQNALASDRLVMLCGLPGMGKTSLAAQAARLAAPARPVLWLTLTAGINNTSEALLRQMAAFLLAHGGEQARPLLAADPRARASFTLDRQMALLVSALASQPVLLCIDNAELVHDDEACLHLLSHIGGASACQMLLMTRACLALDSFTTLDLDGFEPEEARSYIENGAGPAWNEQHILRLVHKTSGSPMLLRLALGRLVNEPAAAEALIAHLETQPQVASYLLQTIKKQLSVNGWRLLLLLAVFQQPVNVYDAFLVEQAQTLGGIQDMAAAVSELQRRRLIDNAAMAHLHPLVRDYVQLTLNLEAAQRQRLHRLAAEWYHSTCSPTEGDPFSAAWHFAQAGLLDDAVDEVEQYQSAIIAHGKGSAAVDILDDIQRQMARRRGDQTDLLRRLLTLRGALLTGTLRVAEGEADLRRALELASTPALQAAITVQLAELLIQRGELQETLRLLQSAQAALPPDDILLRARLWVLETNAHDMMANYAEGELAAKNALELADRIARLSPALANVLRARAYQPLSNMARSRREMGLAMQYARSALEAARLGNQPRAHYLLQAYVGGLLYDAGDLDGSLRYRRQGLEGLQAIGDIHSAAYIQTYLADIQHVRLEEAQALENCRRAVETLRIVEDWVGLAAAQSMLTGLLLWNRRIDEAYEAITWLIREAEGKGTGRLWGYRLNKLAIVQMVRGETAAALETLQQALALPLAAKLPMMRFELHTSLAMARLAHDQTADARQALEEAPEFEGVSRWARFDRMLVKSCWHLASGEAAAAGERARNAAQEASPYPLYMQMSVQVQGLLQHPERTQHFPQALWIGQT